MKSVSWLAISDALKRGDAAAYNDLCKALFGDDLPFGDFDALSSTLADPITSAG